MQENTELIKLPDTEKTHLPLGFKKIFMRKLPAHSIKSKILVYNKKYRFYGTEASGLKKPISKILK